MTTTQTRSPKGARAEMISDAIATHELDDCCTLDSQCPDRAKLEKLLEAEAGQSSLSTSGMDVPPSFGKGGGNGRRVVTMATTKQIAFITRLAAGVEAGQLTEILSRHAVDLLNLEKLGTKAASDLIEVLLGKQSAVATSPGAASEAQLKFLTSLVAERDYYSLLDRDRKLADTFKATGTLSRKDASRLIGELKVTAYASSPALATPWSVAPVARSATQTPEVTEGMYQVGDTIYKVQKAVHGSGRLYAKVLMERNGAWKFEMAKGMVFKLKASDKLSLEAAKAFGQLYGVCCCCGATLTDENSIAEGIGPICASKGF